MSRARYIMIGGFLGAGKSTSVSKMAARLTEGGARVGLITNDQGSGLVDTRSLQARGFQVEEISGGCFCCRFDSLLDAARKLTAETRPDVFVAEPVGSCTDLVATVSYPLRRIYGDDYDIAPFSVLVDPVRARRVLGLDEARNFSDKVLYVYRKQLEEADILVINKVDLLETSQLEELQATLESEYPGKRILTVSARDGDGLDEWFDLLIEGEAGPGHCLDIDYKVYADGEALLGWLNATLRVSRRDEADGNALLMDLAGLLHDRLTDASAEVAHLKMTLMPESTDASPGALFEDIGVINLVRQDARPELSQELPAPVSSGELVVNLRAEAEPDVLSKALEVTLEEFGRDTKWAATLDHIECFSPGEPQPTHRFSSSEAPGDQTPC